MFSKVIWVCLLCLFVTSECERLDPNVFHQLSESRFKLPEVGNTFGITFSFNTADNILVDAHSSNATYSVHILPGGNSPSIVNLFIPMEEVNIQGSFHSEFEIPIVPLSGGRNPPMTTLLYNSGSYRATMARVHLTFSVHMIKSRRGVNLYLHHCHPFMEQIAVQLDEDPPARSHTSLQREFLREIMNMLSREEYGEMFCQAMRRVLASQNAFITQAILNRIKQQQYPKSA